MVVSYLAYTEPINGEGASPILTRDQIWKGLQRKVRRGQDFVPVITDTTVEKDEGNVVTRVAHFKATESAPATSAREVCKSYYPCRVDFHQERDGSVITNTISNGAGLTDRDLHMTYTFEFKYPNVTEGSEEHHKLVQQHTKMSQGAVHNSILAMRKMAEAGELD